ncbi:MAG: N-acetyl-gamma-glutamyl-phosphate reductase [Oscillospiraceae bacterium]|nr:N-acetyl-gamma-glutamyl-phosphate reductase [Oscillospiraceae bacterium]
MPIRVFIDGGEGTTGLRLAERLSGRTDVTLLSIDPALRKDEAAKAKISNAADLVFLCLPDAAAKAAVSGITSPNVKIIDASTAHRVLDDWTYGLPELSTARREQIAAANRICVPGCHATGFNLLAAPLAAAGIAPPDYPFTAHSITGFSGAGKAVIAAYGQSDRPVEYAIPRQYALTQNHKHLPEMQKISGLAHPPAFNPIIADFYAGMVVTVPIHLRLLQKPLSAQELHQFFSDYYAGQKLVKVRGWQAEESLPETMLDAQALAGRDDLEIFVCGNRERAILAARFDNLGKGASGGAIQCMNISFGLPEDTGLVLQ